MKKIIYSLALISLIASCQDAPEGETAIATETQKATVATGGNTYTIDNAASSVTFLGTKPTGTHAGLMHISEGSMNVDNGNITGGAFIIDMTKMESKDADTNYSFKLIGHLLSPDFFDATKYPTAKFEITGCNALVNDSAGATHQISGNLTMKDSTKNVSFPAKISIADANLSATADFIIDRTQWGIHYGNDKSLKDKFVYPEVKITLNIQANK